MSTIQHIPALRACGRILLGIVGLQRVANSDGVRQLHLKRPTIQSWPPVAACWIAAGQLVPNLPIAIYAGALLGLVVSEYTDARATAREATRGSLRVGRPTSRWREVGTWISFIAFSAVNIWITLTSDIVPPQAVAEVICTAVIAGMFRDPVCRVPV